MSSSVPLIGKVHADKDEDGANKEINGDLFVEQPPSKEKRKLLR